MAAPSLRSLLAAVAVAASAWLLIHAESLSFTGPSTPVPDLGLHKLQGTASPSALAAGVKPRQAPKSSSSLGCAALALAAALAWARTGRGQGSAVTLYGVKPDLVRQSLQLENAARPQVAAAACLLEAKDWNELVYRQ
ncbi:hypothetical protein AK812_SmicGene19215 [Symbiodinium microadriaticum]|uniref:Uncharacterized protein n=1 Tax=Symbiodinium microadriaticum TaxID=2951 RepID=A0A1Q9DT93_SYMMI|nr:hypothetical protein AK812_SmicGene19215 [Symbiodinium microadriaticum]